MLEALAAPFAKRRIIRRKSGSTNRNEPAFAGDPGVTVSGETMPS